jgi:hypothetical protein
MWTLPAVSTERLGSALPSPLGDSIAEWEASGGWSALGVHATRAAVTIQQKWRQVVMPGTCAANVGVVNLDAPPRTRAASSP